MAINVNDYKKSRELFQRALKVIPSGIYGHLGPGEGCFSPITAFPLFSDKAKGTHFLDVDGNDFIDYMCAYGPNVLGYRDDDVDAAALAQMQMGDCVTAPSRIMVDFAELLVDTVASADWAFFCKNGGDTTTLAAMTARAYKNRKKIVFFEYYYHGVAPWTQKADYPGVLEEDVANNIVIPFNDVEAFRKVVAENKGEIAALISTPYMHGNFVDNELPKDGFWQQIREICTAEEIVLIIDDVRCGFRLDLAGSDHYYGFEADLICFCKALANGYSVSALCGKKFLQSTVGSLSYTGSYWMSAVPFAAAIACINKMKEVNLPAVIKEKGLRVIKGLEEKARKYGFNLVFSGEPAMFYMRLDNDLSLRLHQQFIAEMVKRGVFMTSHHNHFINYSLSDVDIQRTMDVADEAFKILRANNPTAK